MGSCARSAGKPECISAAAQRASARASGSRGQPRPSSQVSLAYSQIASESQTTRPAWCSTGTLPVGERSGIARRNSSESSASRRSSKATPKCVSSSQGRSDHEE